MKPSVCLYFQIHQPIRFRPMSVFEVGSMPDYVDHGLNRMVMDRVAQRGYYPANDLLTRLIRRHGDDFRFALSFSGMFLEQAKATHPDLLKSFSRLVYHNHVELLSETWNHSLSSVWSPKEFQRQWIHHQEQMWSLFWKEPQVFRNTELIYSDEILQWVAGNGFAGIITGQLGEGGSGLFAGEVPISESGFTPRILARHQKLSDDIGFKFSDENWLYHPLTADKFADWVLESELPFVGIYLDYETFGEHLAASTGIWKFLEDLPQALIDRGIQMVTPSEAIDQIHPTEAPAVKEPRSWADEAQDLSAWMGNDMQLEAIGKVYALEQYVYASQDPEIWRLWGLFQQSDHFYYMATKTGSDAEVHAHFSHFKTPESAYIHFMNALSDFELRLGVEEVDPLPIPFMG
ncbi:glycoside hydrolase family 57 protein [Pontibacter sp. G13]|uniref:glycoside hydrolase family 57 protein n=1 Tax=Pontibacter sp. G13 TaxID=3074898 RepID=UPI00288AD7BA|nr:glycoside hydrolase family 57 protein [Pontibacter sp. G13]WNJ19243.1 glycoside hydrolase family 57 protein [Pontibacter sp. G13]